MSKKISDQKILQVGSIPPPFGGVRVHVKRLNENLINSGVNSRLYAKPFDLLFHDVWHIHLSNAYKRILITILSKFLYKKTVITLHRNFNRDEGIKNYINNLSFKLANRLIFLNDESFSYFKDKYPNKAYQVSAFIPPTSGEESKYPLKSEDYKTIKEKQGKFTLSCTNAHHLRFFNEEDIYGIVEIVKSIKRKEDSFLIISDPSGEYYSYISKKLVIPENILFICYNHSFLNVLKLCDVYLRNTNTDGDSLSIHEALYFGLKVYCTNVVSRPKNVIVYKRGSLSDKIETYDSLSNSYEPVEAISDIINIYRSLVK